MHATLFLTSRTTKTWHIMTINTPSTVWGKIRTTFTTPGSLSYGKTALVEGCIPENGQLIPICCGLLFWEESTCSLFFMLCSIYKIKSVRCTNYTHGCFTFELVSTRLSGISGFVTKGLVCSLSMYRIHDIV